jgi:hypothetical protein
MIWREVFQLRGGALFFGYSCVEKPGSEIE